MSNRWHGIKQLAYDQFVLDSGAVYYNFTSVADPGILLGATRGGITFNRKPKYKELKFEGEPGKVVGSKHLMEYEVSVEANIVTLNTENLALAIPNATSTKTDDLVTLTEGEWDAEAVHKLDNIAVIAEMSGFDDPVIIVINNPLCETDFDLSLKDKSEAVCKWKFFAYQTESNLDESPWKILIKLLYDYVWDGETGDISGSVTDYQIQQAGLWPFKDTNQAGTYPDAGTGDISGDLDDYQFIDDTYADFEEPYNPFYI